MNLKFSFTIIVLVFVQHKEEYSRSSKKQVVDMASHDHDFGEPWRVTEETWRGHGGGHGGGHGFFCGGGHGGGEEKSTDPTHENGRIWWSYNFQSETWWEEWSGVDMSMLQSWEEEEHGGQQLRGGGPSSLGRTWRTWRG
ncbi:hypothetical protein NPIL_486851 [Nephila pilipes]|uniref:Uncharacterized protein n=1 Tax=Nephila pilipes TaxID=299642 RepID=A0A8X6P9T6_NEPPI|nr:hypothetical protein NPIL_486851 [Nephila pilipes]